MLSSCQSDIDTVLYANEPDFTPVVASDSGEDNDFFLPSLHAVDSHNLLIKRDLLQITLELVKLSVVRRYNSYRGSLNVMLLD